MSVKEYLLKIEVKFFNIIVFKSAPIAQRSTVEPAIPMETIIISLYVLLSISLSAISVINSPPSPVPPSSGEEPIQQSSPYKLRTF